MEQNDPLEKKIPKLNMKSDSCGFLWFHYSVVSQNDITKKMRNCKNEV